MTKWCRLIFFRYFCARVSHMPFIMEQRKLYAFDFDGTLTTADTLLGIIRFARGRRFLMWCLVKHLPWLVLMKMGLADNGRVKERVFGYCFGGMKLTEFDSLCVRYADSHKHLMKGDGVPLMKKALAEGSKVVVVSASVENWVKPFVPDAQVVGTQVEVSDGRLTGHFATRNCYGAEKVNRLLKAFPDCNSYRLIAVGDSRGDRELLAFADEAHLIR